MRKLLLLFLLFFNILHSQNLSVLDYSRSILIIEKESNDSCFNFSFYQSISDIQKPNNSNIIYPKGINSSITDKDSLKFNTYRVSRIINRDGSSFDGNLKGEPVFILQEVNKNQILYYVYNKNRFPFKVLEKECDYFNRELDKFNGEITFFTKRNDAPISLNKSISKLGTNYFMSVEFNDDYLTVRGGNLQLLLENGSIINFPQAKLKCEVEEYHSQLGKWRYSSFVGVSKSQLDLLMKNKVTDFKLDIFKEKVSPFDSQYLVDIANCIISIK